LFPTAIANGKQSAQLLVIKIQQTADFSGNWSSTRFQVVWSPRLRST